MNIIIKSGEFLTTKVWVKVVEQVLFVYNY